VSDLDPILNRLDELERGSGELGEVVSSLRASLLITSDIERRHAELRQRHAEPTQKQAEEKTSHEQRQSEHEQMRRRIEANLAEITRKLNRLLGLEPPPTS
jgi:hypothetical protein